MPAPWEFAIDVGGTFTDCVARGPDGAVRREKVLSTGVVKGCAGAGSSPAAIVDSRRHGDPDGFWNGAELRVLDGAGRVAAATRVARFDAAACRLALEPPLLHATTGADYEIDAGHEAPVLAIRRVLATPPHEPTPPVRLRLGTTRGTNALLTHTGARTALAVTRGFGDLLEIGDQARPRLFDLAIRKPPPLAERTIEIAERVTADGQVLVAPDAAAVRRQLAELHAAGIESLAICLLHADLHPAHERLVERLARDAGFVEISRSSEVAPLVKIVSRAETAVVDAYLNPVLRDYVARLEQALPGSQIRLMTSAGGLAAAGSFRGFESVLSGPAGGVVGYARGAALAGRRRVIGFDMGGTSTDVSRFDGRFEYEFESHKAGVRLVAPTLAIETVAAGGGSICSFDGVQLTVGPASAGADPGPACYGRGGPLCITDVNLFLGRLAEERFPFAPDHAAVERRLASLAEDVAAATGERIAPRGLAEGLLAIAHGTMVRAIRSVTVTRGYDPREYTLAAFGGAAGQHACAVARELGIREILIDADASLLSARGIELADVTRHAAAGVYRPADDVADGELEETCERLAAPLVAQIAAEGVEPCRIETQRSVDVRYRGVDAAINVPLAAGTPWRDEFQAAHLREFGYHHPGRDVEVAAVRVEVVGRMPPALRCQLAGGMAATPRVTTATAERDRACAGPAVYERARVSAGACVAGPALIVDSYTTIVVEPGWSATCLDGGELLLTDSQGAAAGTPPNASPVDEERAPAPAAVQLEVFSNLLAGVAERMGHVLRRTAMSVNIKERLDYSCAVFTAAGELAASAAHIPVHLGAMGATVRAVIADNPDLRPGDAIATNDPYRGGSHLPDVTVVLPVHDERTGRLMFFTACRAHHAEIGGARPGSMPPRAVRLGDEGVVIGNFLLLRDGQLRESALRQLLSTGPFPSRSIDENVADLRAQAAAAQQGANDLRELVERHSASVIERQMHAIQDAAEAKVRAALGRLEPGEMSFVDWLETADGRETPISVKATIPHDRSRAAAVFDFTGTGPVVAGNLNANPAIVSAAVLYVLRLLLDEDVPLNEGALRAVRVVLPPCLLNPPAAERLADSPAVAAGNVETSQRVVDVLLGALGLAAASQGTMNNVLFGGDAFGYYETVGGGSGATATAHGASAVQVHMTNTRATDPEVLERRLPVRLCEYSVRRGSGGAGARRGGDGVVRRIEFLAPLELSLVTQRRGCHRPFGLAGGAAGAAGENLLHRADGSVELLAAIVECAVAPGDVLELRTPGGGGFGPAISQRTRSRCTG